MNFHRKIVKVTKIPDGMLQIIKTEKDTKKNNQNANEDADIQLTDPQKKE